MVTRRSAGAAPRPDSDSAASDTRLLLPPVTRTTGVWPRRPQVRPFGGLKLPSRPGSQRQEDYFLFRFSGSARLCTTGTDGAVAAIGPRIAFNSAGRRCRESGSYYDQADYRITISSDGVKPPMPLLTARLTTRRLRGRARSVPFPTIDIGEVYAATTWIQGRHAAQMHSGEMGPPPAVGAPRREE